MIYKQKER